MNNSKNTFKINNVKEITDSFSLCSLDNIFIVFKSINNIFYLIYATKNNSIFLYELLADIKICEIKKAHKEYISNFRHHLDKINKRDLMISISSRDSNIKLWNIGNIECLLSIKGIYKEGYLNSSCFLEDNNHKIYIITSNFNFNTFEPIKVFDLEGKELKEINDSNDKTYIIDSYFDEISNKNYISTGNMGCIKSFDFQENKLYNIFRDDSKRPHFSLIFFEDEKDKILKLIDSCYDGLIRIWNFHTIDLLNIINISHGINSISLFNDNYIFISCYDKEIKIVNILNGEIKEFLGINKDIISLVTVGDSSFGYYLITEGFEEDPIVIYNLEM